MLSICYDLKRKRLFSVISCSICLFLLFWHRPRYLSKQPAIAESTTPAFSVTADRSTTAFTVTQSSPLNISEQRPVVETKISKQKRPLEQKLHQGPGVKKGFLLLVGDSTDRGIVQFKCDRTSGSRSIPGDSDELAVLWEQIMPSWAVPANGLGAFFCHLPKGVVLGFLFNPFGVHPCGPWHKGLSIDFVPKGRPLKEVEFQSFASKVCSWGRTYGTLMAQRVFKRLFKSQIEFVIKYMRGAPEIVALASNFWDVARMVGRDNSGLTALVQSYEARRIWSDSWKINATSLLHAMQDLLPESTRFAWRLHYYPKYIPLQKYCTPSGKLEINDWRLDLMIKVINANALEFVRTWNEQHGQTRLQTVDLPALFPKLQRVNKDGWHAAPAVAACYADTLISRLLDNHAADTHVKTCTEAHSMDLEKYHESIGSTQIGLTHEAFVANYSCSAAAR